MAGLVVALLDVRALDDRQRAGRHGFRTRAQYDAFVHAYPAARQRLLDGYEATLAAVCEVWGCSGRDTFDREAQRQANALA